MKYDIVYDETIVSYMELYCFLGAYFQYIITNDTQRQHALHEVARFCTNSFVQRVITQIDTLLVTNKTDDSTLLTWLNRTSNGWQAKDGAEARHHLLQLQVDLKNALHHERTRTQPARKLSYAHS